MQIRIEGIEQAVANLSLLPKKVAFKHLRIGLSAAGGQVQKVAKALAPKDSGLLKASISTKVKIPDQSWDIKHHGKPAYVVIGPKRRAGQFLHNDDFLGKAKAAQKALQAARKRLAEQGFGTGRGAGLARERLAVRQTKTQFRFTKYRNPSRYAHLMERRTKFISMAADAAGTAAANKLLAKLAAAFELEAFSLAKFRTGKAGAALGIAG